jgi:hypothetical protein
MAVMMVQWNRHNGLIHQLWLFSIWTWRIEFQDCTFKWQRMVTADYSTGNLIPGFPMTAGWLTCAMACSL